MNEFNKKIRINYSVITSIGGYSVKINSMIGFKKILNDFFNILLVSIFLGIFIYIMNSKDITLVTYDNIQISILFILLLWFILSISIFRKYYNKIYYIAIIFAIFFTFCRIFIFSYSTVNGTSMYPTLSSGDNILFNRTKNIDRFDIIIIEPPSKDSIYIKRVIAFEGESVKFINGVLYINDIRTNENFSHIYQDLNMDTLRIPKGHIFVLGDNRPNSLDSRMLGPFPKNNLIGKYLLKIPF